MRDVSCENCGLEVCRMRRPSSTFAAVASSHSGIAELPSGSIDAPLCHGIINGPLSPVVVLMPHFVMAS